MRRFALPGIITAAAVALLVVLAFGVAHSGPSNTLDKALDSGKQPVAPSAHMALPVIGTKQSEDLAALRGHLVMVDFAAGWCTACQADAGVVESAERRLQKAGGTVIGVTYQDSDPDAESYLKRYHLTYPMLQDANGNLATAYGVNGVPETFIVNAQGKVIELCREQLTQTWVNRALNQALSKDPSSVSCTG